MTQAMAGSVANAGGVYVMLLCIGMVALYAFNRYNTPATNITTTTRSLFYLTGCCYVVSSLALFFLLSEVVLKPGVLQVMGLDGGEKLAAELSAPLLAAIILTTLLPSTPWVNTFDQWLLKVFQDWGRIPTGVSHLANRMPLNALSVRDSDIADLGKWIAHSGDLPNRLIACLGADPDAPSGWMTRVMRIFKETEKLKDTPRYADAFRSILSVWQGLQSDFRVFISQSDAFFVLFNSLKAQDSETIQKALLQADADYKDRCDALYRSLTEFLAQTMLISEDTGHMVDQRLRWLGYEIATEEEFILPIGPFVFMGLALMITILGLVALWPQPQVSGSVPLAVVAVLIAATKAIGAAAAVLPKLRWPAFRKSDAGELPYLGWVISALAAAVISFAFERIAAAVCYGSSDVIFNFSLYKPTPLAPTSFMLCLAVAILCDVDFRLGTGPARRWKEALICSGTMLVSVVACLRLAHLPAPTSFPYIVSSLLGLVTGYFAPYLYRRARKEEVALPAHPVEAMPDMGPISP
jgi:hypothetical protein